ncbi:hypothetical protein V5O48_008316 [Marasmius crinis-equi]|uniref:Extracellular membrane protein CFEM domain-containing protein n=1 Tax=Marasmius crinis-equi TaxID=585013 RepID=A0ABR3FE92_9AGAR
MNWVEPISVRQTIPEKPTIPSSCSQTCLTNAPLNCTVSPDCSCTDQYVDGLGTCLDCAVKQDNSQLGKAQAFIDSGCFSGLPLLFKLRELWIGLINSCNGLGKSVKSRKITGDSSSGGSNNGSGSSNSSGTAEGSNPTNTGSSGGGNGAASLHPGTMVLSVLGVIAGFLAFVY